MQRSHRFPVGSIDVRLDVQRGVIESCKIYGDFFGMGDVEDLEQRLVGTRYERDDLAAVLADVDISYYFGKIPKDEFSN